MYQRCFVVRVGKSYLKRPSFVKTVVLEVYFFKILLKLCTLQAKCFSQAVLNPIIFQFKQKVKSVKKVMVMETEQNLVVYHPR